MKRSSLFAASLLTLASVSVCGAQGSSENGVTPALSETTAIIAAPSDTAVGRTTVLDGTASRTSGERVEYIWTIDQTKQVISRTVQAIYTPERTGSITFRLTVKSTSLQGKAEESQAVHEMTVYKRKIVLIADNSISTANLQAHIDEAMQKGVYIRVIRPANETPVLELEDRTFALLHEGGDVLSGAEAIVVWSDGIAGLQALLRLAQSDSTKADQIRSQNIVLLTNGSLSTLERSTRGAFSVLRPKEVAITRNEALNPLLSSEDFTQFQQTILSRDIDVITAKSSGLSLRPWNLISSLVNYLLSHGVSGQTVILLLMLPVIATIFAFLKQIIGITSFGLYTPSIVTLSFLALGWMEGLLFLLFILVTGYITRSLMRRWRLLYIPKVAIILTTVSLTLLLLVGLGTFTGLTFTRETIFILLILSTLAENFLNLKTEEGWWSAILGVGETVLGALLCVVIVQWQPLQAFVLAYPEVILLTLVINAFLGRWTGLRLMEYFRFREVFKHLQEE